MQRIRRGIALAALASVAMSGAAIAAPSALAAPDAKQVCTQELGLRQPTTKDAISKTPVILVHGLWSKPRTWSEGRPSMYEVLSSGDRAIYQFDYESANGTWVTEGDTAHRLAKTIVCFSKLYGDKRVVIVAHSMGGLLTRAALDWAAYGTFAKKVTGHVVTIGTPHEGADIGSLSYYANISLCNAAFVWWGDEAQENCRVIESSKAVSAMRPGSDELVALPHLPSGISIKAIAGEVKAPVCAFWGCSEPRSTGGDLLVSVKSATAEYTTTGVGDGKVVFDCVDPVAVPNASHPWCEHSSMLKSPRVQSEVKTSIQAYLAEAKPKPIGIPHEFFGVMTLYLKSDLKVQAYHGEGPSEYEVACVDSAACPVLSVFSPSEVGGDLGWKTWGLPECAAAQDGNTSLSVFGPIVEKGTRKIGGKTARYYEAELCAGGVPRETARFWEVIDGSIFVAKLGGDNRWWADEDKIVASATWK